MASPRRWTVAGLLLIVTSSLTIVNIVFDFRAHGREDPQIKDCISSFDDKSKSSVPLLFAMMVMTKISMTLVQLGMAMDCFITADMKLKEASNTPEWSFVFQGLGLCVPVSLTLVVLLISAWADTDCFSCCVAHERVIVYVLWCTPFVLMASLVMAVIALAVLLALICGLFFGLKNFLRLLFLSFTYEPVSTDVSKDVEVV